MTQPTLQGTEKQVKWAKSIRNYATWYINNLAGLFDHRVEWLKQQNSQDEKVINALAYYIKVADLLHSFLANGQAKFWIENRHMIDKLIDAVHYDDQGVKVRLCVAALKSKQYI